MVSLLKSSVLATIPGVVHGFTDRCGGVSPPAQALNLALHVGDDPAAVRENRTRVLAALERPAVIWVSVQQVHGDTVVEVTARASRTIEADALITRDANAAVAVLVADCVPILIAHTSGRVVAAVHAGWRGTAARVVARAVARLGELGFPATELRVALGPAIGPCCFTVGAEVAEQLAAGAPHGEAAILRGADGTLRADLWQLNRQLLEEAGVPPIGVECLRRCTACQAELFSHRREAGRTGRQAGVIVPGRVS